MADITNERLKTAIENNVKSYTELSYMLYKEIIARKPRVDVMLSIARTMEVLYRQFERYMPASLFGEAEGLKVEVEVVSSRNAQDAAQGG